MCPYVWNCLCRAVCVCVSGCMLLFGCVCVCERFCCLCNETPEVSERHSGVTEGRTGAPAQEVFLHCCAAAETVAACLSFFLELLVFILKNLQPGGGEIHSTLFTFPNKSVEQRSRAALSTCSSSFACAALMRRQCSNPGGCWEVKGEEEKGRGGGG